MRNEKLRGNVYIILSAVLFGMMPLMTKTIFAHGGNACTAAFFRFTIGALLLFLIVKFGRGEEIWIGGSRLMSAMGLSAFYAVMLGLLYSSYAYISSGMATTLHFTYPAAVILLQLVLFRLYPSRWETASLGLAVAGVFLMNLHSGEANAAGMILAVLSGISYAFYIVLYGRSKVKGLSAFVMAFWISVFAGLMLGIFNTFTGSWKLPSDAEGWCATVLLAFLTDVLALVLFQRGLAACGGVTASLLSTLEPITGLAVGFLVYHETLGISSVIAVLLILCSVLIVLLGSGKNEAA